MSSYRRLHQSEASIGHLLVSNDIGSFIRPGPSPTKRNDPRKKQRVMPSGHRQRAQTLRGRLFGKGGIFSREQTQAHPQSETSSIQSHDDHWEDVPDSDTFSELPPPSSDVPDQDEPPASQEAPLPSTDTQNKCPPNKNEDEAKIQENWKKLLPSLVEPYMDYLESTSCKSSEPAVEQPLSTCKCLPIACGTMKIRCYSFTKYVTRRFKTCGCSGTKEVIQRLVKEGFFPTKPWAPQDAVSIDVLDFLLKLMERAGTAVTAMMDTFRDFWASRGYVRMNKEGAPIKDPLRKGLGYALEWYSMLISDIEKRVAEVLKKSLDLLLAYKRATSQPEEAKFDESLSSKCPLCFGGIVPNGREEQEIHVSIDGNFHHRRHKSAKAEGPVGYPHSFFIPKEEVDAVGARIDIARPRTRKRPASRRPKVSSQAVEGCRHSFKAAQTRHTVSKTDRFADKGLMSMVCRHGLPLFFTNIDTPGEKQQYAVTLIERLFSLLPNEAKVCVYYDVGCVLEKSLNKFHIIDDQILDRLRFATTAMHAYAHHWACQICYGPRFLLGAGLTDGEAIERLWSMLRIFIGPTRSSGALRRLWLLDRGLAYILSNLLSGVGDWINKRLTKAIQKREQQAKELLKDCELSHSELRKQWDHQCKVQSVVKQHTPAAFKRGLNTLASLHSELEGIQESLREQESVEGIDTNETSLRHADELEATQARLNKDISVLYTSLNIPESFPELEKYPRDFVTLLLLTRDLKAVIRERAIQSFAEWDRVDQAQGGVHQPLGTKMHQRTRQSITNRQKPIINLIKLYNKYCDDLKGLLDPSFTFPLPQPLPTTLAAIRKCEDLHCDVLLGQSTTQDALPLWLVDSKVQNGIKGLLQLDRIAEERQRLAEEARNMTSWLAHQLVIIEISIRTELGGGMRVLLERLQSHLHTLRFFWKNPLVDEAFWESCVQEAVKTAEMLTKNSNSYETTGPISPKSSRPRITTFDNGGSDSEAVTDDSDIEGTDNNIGDIPEPDDSDEDSILSVE